MKLKVVETLHENLGPICKNEKDIKLLKHYLSFYSGFLAAYASSEDGCKNLLKYKPAFEFALFLMDTISP